MKRLVGSGGMPSSHSATVTALALAVGLQEGFGGSHFAIALVLTAIVCVLISSLPFLITSGMIKLIVRDLFVCAGDV